MESFSKFGTAKGEDLQHANMASLADFPHDRYAKMAEAFLAKASVNVLTSVKEIFTGIEGKWNPGGFMVFPLGLLDDGSSLRLHVWPEGMERDTDQGPNPHNHSLHLSSRILIGTYSDVILDVEPAGPEFGLVEAALKRDDIYTLYATHRTPGGKDILKTDGTLVRAIPRVSRTLKEGDSHHIPVDQYHQSNIPTDLLTATLVLDSPAFRASSNVLLKSQDAEILRIRRNLEQEQLRAAMDQVVRHLESRE